MEGSARFDYQPSTSLPPLAWLASIEAGVVEVRCGSSVRCTERGFVESTWVGDPDVATLPRSTTVFGSGLVDDGDGLVLVPPSHPLERLYVHGTDGRVSASNSLVWLLEATGLDLDPDTLYPPIFVRAAEGIRHTILDVPTTGTPLQAVVYHNVRLAPAGDLRIEERPHERPFDSYADYRTRLAEALSSAVANARGYEMVATISSGYDSTAVAAVAAEVGCRRAVTFTVSKPVARGTAVDSGEATAERLGMAIEKFDRLSYLDRADLPEAEFLATGMTGEDVVMIAAERSIAGSILLTGSEAYRLKGNPYRPGLYRGDLSSCSLTELRLRTDFIHLPLLFFGASEQPSLIEIIDSAEMRPFSVPGLYDKPIQRRIAENAGIPRGTFATIKRRSSASIHREGLVAMSEASAASVRDFAARHGGSLDHRRRFTIKRRHRLVLRSARRLRLDRFTSGLAARRRSLIHFEPDFGSLLFRWAVETLRPRYGVEPDAGEATVLMGQLPAAERVAASICDGP